MTSGGTSGMPSRTYQSGGLTPDRVHADEHLAGPRLGDRHVVEAQHLGAAELVQSDGLHRVRRHRFSVSSAGRLS